MAKKKTPAKKAKTEKNKKVASARQAKPVKKPALKAKPVAAAKAATAKPVNGKTVLNAKALAKKPVPAKSAAAKSAKAPVAPAKAPAAKPPVATKALKGAASTPERKVAAAVSKKAKAEAGKKALKAAIAATPEVAAPESEIILTNAEGKRYCKVGECDELATSDSYCRYHYLLNWKKIQLRKKILAGDKLNRYIEELTARYPDKYLEMIRKDLATDKDFLAALQELEIDEGADDYENEDDSKTYVDEIRGTGGGGGGQEEDDY